MNSQYTLVILSIILAIIAGTGIFFHLKNRPKKINFLFLLIVLSILPVISIFRPGSYESSDLSAHVTFAMSFFKALTDGVLVPRWGMDLNYTYGYPSFLFIYLLPYYIISLLHLVAIPFLLATKLVLALSFILSGITMYYFAKEELGELGGFIAAIFYLYAPYHLVDLHFRVDIGEIVAFVFLPFLLYAIKKIFKNRSVKNTLLVSLLFAALILSHPALSVAGIPLVAVYIFYLLKNSVNKRESLSTTILALLIGVFLTSFYWFPILVEGKFTSVYQHGYQIIFPNIRNFLISPYYFGLLYQGHKGELSFPLGFVQLILIVLIPFVLKKKELLFQKKLLILLLFALIAFYFFLMQSIAKPFWYIIPLIKNFQFSYRLMGIIIFCVSFCAGVILPLIKNKKLLVLILALTILSTILNWGNRKNVPTINEQYLQSHISQSDKNYAVMGQAIPKWADNGITRPWILSFPSQHLQVVIGNANVIQKQRTTTKHTYEVQANIPSILQENTWYFPGWAVFDNGKQIPAYITSGNQPGLVRFLLLPGTHLVSILFLDTWDRIIGINVSICTAIICAMVFILSLVFSPKKAYSVKKKK